MDNGKRLIDANAMREDWLENGENEYVYDTNAVLDSIDAQPTVDAVEVVYGRWIKYKDDKFIGYDADGRAKYRNVYSYNCDKCGHGTAVKSNYCPACGAKMEGVKEVGY